MKIVINDCYGGFGLSTAIRKRYLERTGKKLPNDYEVNRSDPILIALIEELKEKSNARYGALKIVEIPDGVDWCIEEYDGSEWVTEKHRTWS